MARWSDLQKLRMDMDILQAKVRNMHSRGYDYKEISNTVQVPESNIRVIIRWCCK